MASLAASSAHLQPGALVRACGRDWVVLPSPDPDLVLLRPLNGHAEQTVGIFLPLERGAITPSVFAPPEPAQVGDTTGCFLLHDAARLGIRNSAGSTRQSAHADFAMIDAT